MRDEVRENQIRLKIQQLRGGQDEACDFCRFILNARELCDEVEGLLKELSVQKMNGGTHESTQKRG